MTKIRTRFAPSPTGRMHVGNLRTALYAYLITKHEGGDFILRIEDTDQERYVEGAVDIIYRTLAKTGLLHDEGPDKDKGFGPYVQSERQAQGIYLKYAQQLVEQGDAYYCFCKKEELEGMKRVVAGKEISIYDKRCLKLSKEEVQRRLDAGEPHVIRFNMPTEGTTTFHDVIYGDITVNNEEMEALISEELESFTGLVSFEKSMPGLTDIYQIIPAKGGRSPETPEDMRLRITQEMSHRNRAVLPRDYEQITLAQFPEVEKVLCLPGIDSKAQNRSPIVTLVVMQKEKDKKILPLCEHRLLMRIEDYIGDKTSPFITVDAITPVYEEVTVCCNLRIKPGYPVGDILRQTEARINNCIAPWRDKEEIPVFGLSFSSTDLYNSIRECEAIVDIDILSVAHVVYTAKDQQKSYYLNRYPEEARQNFNVSPSQPWCILVPSDRHLLYIDQKDELLEQLGLGYLGVGSNFIINK